MPEDLVLVPVHWTRPAAIADADQPVAPIRGILRLLRSNQWLVLYRQVENEVTGYFPYRKAELQERLIGAPPLAITSEVLSLPISGANPLERRIWKLPEPPELFPERSRPVWLDKEGGVLGVGITRGQNYGIERVASSLRIAAEEMLVDEHYSSSIEKLRLERAFFADSDEMQFIDFSDPEMGHTLHAVSSGPLASVPVPSPSSSDNELIVSVLFGTDREIIRGPDSKITFANGRARNEETSLGVCSVSLPHDHRIGHFERPQWWKFWSSPARNKHIMLLSTTLLSSADFFGEVRASTFKSDKKDAFIFIHGYNVSFEQAALRTAQLAIDLQFNGAPILFSWPSKAKEFKYLDDEGSIQWARPHLEAFISEVSTRTNADALHLIAHSMGNRALMDILHALAQHPGGPRFQQLVLAAPDVDAGVFAQLAQSACRISERVTLYASSNDRALSASRSIHGFSRAGEAGDDLLVLHGLDTIDATSVDTDFLGHSAFVQERALMSDMFGLLRHGHAPDSRFGLTKRIHPNGTYWDFIR